MTAKLKTKVTGFEINQSMKINSDKPYANLFQTMLDWGLKRRMLGTHLRAKYISWFTADCSLLLSKINRTYLGLTYKKFQRLRRVQSRL